LEEEPTRALAREARGLAEEEEESPQAAAPETRSRIAMVHRCSSQSSASVVRRLAVAFRWFCLVWCFFPSSATLVGCALLLSVSASMLLIFFFYSFFFNFHKEF